MKKLLIIILSVLSLTSTAQQTVVLLEPRVGEGSTAVTGVEKRIVQGELRKAFFKLAGFDAVTSTGIDQMMKEQNFQRTGLLSDAQIKRIGEMSNADYICVSTLTKSDTEFYMEAYLIHVGSGRMFNPASQYGELMNGKLANMLPACNALANELLGEFVTKSNLRDTPDNIISLEGQKSSHQDFTETAWGINMKMIWVEGGDFLMGCTSEQGGDCYADEKNVRRVTVDGFYIGMLEVTQSQYEKVMRDTSVNDYFFMKEFYDDLRNWNCGKSDSCDNYSPWWFGQELNKVGPNYPMYLVDAFDAEDFCSKLSKKTGKTYMLPTEAQWEYAARGGKGNNTKQVKYSGSNTIEDVAWFDNNSNNSVHICGTLKPNALGIYDMSGNVSEWCLDWYEEAYLMYDTNNPTGPQIDYDAFTPRVRRGGSWGDEERICRVSCRNSSSYGVFSEHVGFRVVCIPNTNE